MREVLLAVVMLSAGLVGCIGSEDAPAEPAAASAFTEFTPCEHPWPCADGSEWPADLSGPFELNEIVSHRVSSFDGTELAGHVWMPDVPEGTRVPVVLWSSPYFGQPPQPYVGDPGQPTNSEELWEGEPVPVGLLVESGYAVAAFNVRGTGDSGGCFEDKGPKSQRDQAVLVEWLGEQPWSNGRVAMMGLSHPGTTPWMAAMQAPEALKTIVTAGMVSDEYLSTTRPRAPWEQEAARSSQRPSSRKRAPRGPRNPGSGCHRNGLARRWSRR